ncbi:MAG: tetratricopeptide repeat protein [Planctomycetes bacterium]|nr:tetratricopeptide repeat protein [Planctomycetota bacterium]MCB9870555.1 tetratricopeptide repeat protein [Planctomycetota bacterium]MCB9889723.1 tetratricopeptide repeat protein [Planctomycetota bacterium]
MNRAVADGVRGCELAITGRLLSMSRDEAIRAIEQQGGTYVASPRPSTGLLVVGSDGPPLRRDGRPTRSLVRARELCRRGAELVIVDEPEFVARLGLGDRGEDLRRLYTVEQLGRILSMPSAEIRAWVRHRLIQPTKVVKRLCYFDFAQVACARRVQRLVRSGVSARRVHRSLQQIHAWLPSGGSALPRLEPLERCGALLVRLEDGCLAEPNGQLHFDFERGSAGDDEPTHKLLPRQRTASEWFDVGIEAEQAGALECAAEAYEQAMALPDLQPEVCFNLGNTYYAMDRHVEATACFMRALEIDPEYVEAWNNLGNALCEIDKSERAIDVYRRAIAIEPSYADAHYNLAETLALRGDVVGAQRHWREYLRHDPNSPWAVKVRARLRELP